VVVVGLARRRNFDRHVYVKVENVIKELEKIPCMLACHRSYKSVQREIALS